MHNYQLGELVLSTAGRDSGRYFIIVEIVDDKFVKISDGDLRTIEDPKLKNIKHIKKTGEVEKELGKWLKEDRRVRNEDLKQFIKEYEKGKGA